MGNARTEGMGRCPGRNAGLIALAFCILAHPIQAARPESGPATVLKATERLLEEGEFENAVKKLRALNQRQALTRPAQAQSYYLLGWAYLYLGNTAGARATYQRLVHLDPRFTLPSHASPKIKMLFDQARRDTGTSPRAPSAPARPSRLSETTRLQVSSASYLRFSHLPRVPRYRGPNPVARRKPEREVASRPAVSNIAGWTHWIERERLP